jgi:hypothetical protein
MLHCIEFFFISKFKISNARKCYEDQNLHWGQTNFCLDLLMLQLQQCVQDICMISLQTKLQIPFFGSGPKPLEHFITLHSDQNSMTSSLGFTILGSIYSYHSGRLEYSGGSDRNQNSGSSSNSNIVLANNDRPCPQKSKTLFNWIKHLFIKCYS